MAFEYVQDDPAKAREIRARVIGSVFSFNGKFAFDRDNDAVVVDLGEQPESDPGNNIGPCAYFNLQWGNDIFTAVGNTQLKKDGLTYVTEFNVAVTAPKSAEGRIEDARQLMEQGLAVIESAYSRMDMRARLIFSKVTYR